MWFPKNIIYFKIFFHCRSLLWNILSVIILSVITDQIGLPWWLSGKEPACQCRICGSHPWVGEISWRRKWQPIPIFLPGKSHGQRSLAGYTVHAITAQWLNNSNWSDESSVSLPFPKTMLTVSQQGQVTQRPIDCVVSHTVSLLFVAGRDVCPGASKAAESSRS